MAGTKRKIAEVDGPEVETIPSVKDLASSEPRIRRHAIQKVMAHLESRPSKSQLSSIQALQLWRGFHVALYMHDSKSAISVQNLITELANTFNTVRSKDEELEDADSSSESSETNNEEVPRTNKKSDNATQVAEDDEWNGLGDEDKSESAEDEAAIDESRVDKSWLSTWSTAFWATMIREWSNIDSHRINKYLLLVRTVLRQILTICLEAHIRSSSLTNTASTKHSSTAPVETQKTAQIPSKPIDTHRPTESQSSSLITSQMTLLSLYPLQPRDSRIPNGLRLHILDIYVDELQTAITLTTPSSTTASANKNDPDTQNHHRPQPISEMLIGPLRTISQTGLVKVVRVRAKEELARFKDEVASLFASLD